MKKKLYVANFCREKNKKLDGSELEYCLKREQTFPAIIAKENITGESIKYRGAYEFFQKYPMTNLKINKRGQR